MTENTNRDENAESLNFCPHCGAKVLATELDVTRFFGVVVCKTEAEAKAKARPKARAKMKAKIFAG